MARKGRSPKLHMLDGRQVTHREAAEILGMTENALWQLRHKHKEMSLQLLADYRRGGCMGSRTHRYGQTHLVDGQWVSIADVGKMFGVTANAVWKMKHIESERRGRQATMQDVVDRYRDIRKFGRRRPGKVAKLYPYQGKQRTVAEIARMAGCSRQNIYVLMQKYGIDAGAAAKRSIASREKQAVNKIARIITEGARGNEPGTEAGGCAGCAGHAGMETAGTER